MTDAPENRLTRDAESTTGRLREHPDRLAIAAELHARPFESLSPPLRATHLAMLGSDAEGDRAHVARLCSHQGQVAPGSTATHHSVDLGPFRLRWERHTEFSTYTIFVAGSRKDGPFTDRALDRVPPDWLDNMPGEMVVAVHLALEDPSAPARDVQEVFRLFETENIAGSLVADDGAKLFTDFRLHSDGFGRVLIQIRDLPPRRTGRLVQRVLEIETYRLMALLAFPLARQATGELTHLDERLRNITDRMTRGSGLEGQQALLTELSDLAGELERISAQNTFRLSAARAYSSLVQHRIKNLRESRLPDLQTINEFMARRFSPAMQTCESVSVRQDALSERLSRAAELMRTRVDVALEAQNRDLLASMNRRTHLQLRLQQTVEGLSVVVISYYASSLLSYIFHSAEEAGLPINATLTTGIAVPFVVTSVWVTMRVMRRRLLGKADIVDP